MKLRLRENSIRLRLLRSEVSDLRKNGSSAEIITFGKTRALTYRVEISDAAETISARFQNDEITVEIPRAEAIQWIDTEQTGLQSVQQTGGEKPLSILIEKDFVCVERPADTDNLDAFPHPKMKC